MHAHYLHNSFTLVVTQSNANLGGCCRRRCAGTAFLVAQGREGHGGTVVSGRIDPGSCFGQLTNARGPRFQ